MNHRRAAYAGMAAALALLESKSHWERSKIDKTEPIRAPKRPGRNDPCSCGSGQKFKRCCYRKGGQA